MGSSHETSDRFQKWFRAKREEMLARARQAQDHPGLVGSHREALVREFLSELLPSRLSVERGIVYSPVGRSAECDVVIWDSANYPRLSLIDHSSFLVESVSVVVEVKSRYSASELAECAERCDRLRRLSLAPGQPELLMDWRIDSLEERVAALEQGDRVSGQVISHPRVAYGVLFLQGGESVTIDDVLASLGADPDFDEIPSFIAFLSSGKFFRRFEPSSAELEDGELPFIARYESGDDILGQMTDEILRLVRLRTPSLTAVWDLSAYRGEYFPAEPAEVCELSLTRHPHGRRVFYEPRPSGEQ